MRRRPIRAPRTHALPPYDTHFVHLSCLPRTAAGTKRVRARSYSRRMRVGPHAWTRPRAHACTRRGDATSLSNCLETRADPVSPAFNPSEISLPPPPCFSFLLFNSPRFFNQVLVNYFSFFLQSIFIKKEIILVSTFFENSCKIRLIL